MRQRLRSHLTYANVTATIALCIALGGGTAYAVDGPLAGQNTVGSEDIINTEVKTADLGADTVTSGKIADGQVKSADVLNDNLAAADLASGSVAGAEVKDASVANSDVAPNSLSSARILDGTLTGTDVADNSLKGADIDESTLSNIGGGGPAGGDLTGTYPNPLVASNAVGGAEVADDSLTGSDVQESRLGTVPSASNADALNGKTAGQLEGARASALVSVGACDDPGGFCTVLRSRRVAYVFHAGNGQFCVGVDGISAAASTSIAVANPAFGINTHWAYWIGGFGNNVVCAEPEFEIYTGVGTNRLDVGFTIVIP